MRPALNAIRLICFVIGLYAFQCSGRAVLSKEWLWERANTLYAAGAWDSAAHYYNDLIRAGNTDAAVYYNLGNVHYKLGHTGAAILAYRRALLRKPDYKVATENLQLAESRIPGRLQPPEEVFFIRWWKSFTGTQYSGIWAVSALLLFAIAIFLLYKRRISKETTAPQLVVAAFLLWGIFLTLAIVSAQRTTGNKEAVVMRPKAILKTAEGKNILSLPEGTVVREKGERARDVEVVLPDGRSGWLSLQDVAAVN